MSVLSLKSCEIMQYWSYMDTQSIDEIINRIKSLTQLKDFSIITHDKDILPSGENKPPHFHAVLTFRNATTVTSIAKAIKVEEQFVSKIKSTTKSARLYQVHRNNPEKYQYQPSEVIASFDFINYVDDIKPKQRREDIAERIANGEIKRYNIEKYIGCDEFAKNKRYYENCFEYRQNLQRSSNRNMVCYYIQGESGIGKTVFAKDLANKLGFRCFVSSGGKNPLDDYKGEEVIIMDDTRSQNWDMSDFLKLTDNHTDSLVGCRYYNKSIYECQFLIVTSVHSIEKFFENAKNTENEPIEQLLRRFKCVFKCTENEIEIWEYIDDLKKHIRQGTMINPVKSLRTRRDIQPTVMTIEKLGYQILKTTLIDNDDDLPF